MTATTRDRRRRRAPGPAVLALLFIGLLAPRLAAAPLVQEAWIRDETWGPWMQLLGRLHFALIHFPIGLLIAAGVIELCRAGRKGPRPSSPTLVCLGLGWMGAALAAYSGWTYAAIERHGHDPEGLLFWHRWGGVAVAVAAFLTWCLGFLGRSGRRGWARTAFALMLLVTTIGTGLVGHFGGALVYGEDYLAEPFEEREKARRIERFGPAAEVVEPPTPAADPTEDAAEDLAEDQAEDQAVSPRDGGPVDPAEGAAKALTGGEERGLEVGLTDRDPREAPTSATAGDQAGTGGTTIGDFLDPDATPPAADEAALWDEIALVFDLSCYHCHGSRKAKGDLRLHERERLFEDDPGAWVVVPGHPERSELFRRLSLPADHEDLMPSDDDPLPAEEIALVRAWIAALDPIAHGLPADGGTAGSEVLGDWSEVTLPPAGGGDGGAGGDGADAPAQDAGADTVIDSGGSGASTDATASPAAVAAALDALATRGAVATRIAEDSPDVDVVLGLLREDVTDADLQLLRGLEPVLVSLDLSRTAVTDAGLAVLADFRRLERLRLDNTGIGNAGLVALRDLEHLAYLNLYGTAVGDEGLGELTQLESLRSLYLWQTAVTDAGVAALEAALPELEIVRDVELPEPPPPLVVVEGETTFAEHAGPILEAKCVACHGPEDPPAGLRFDSFDAVFAGSWAEWAVKPGEPELSRLLVAVRREPGTEGAMPKKGEPLTAEEIDVLVAWIAGLREEEAPEEGGGADDPPGGE